MSGKACAAPSKRPPRRWDDSMRSPSCCRIRPSLWSATSVRRRSCPLRSKGAQSSLCDLMLHEAGGAPAVPTADGMETSNAVAAVNHGVERLRGGFPLSNRLLRETHARLLMSGRGGSMMPGEFRRSQNWIGGSRPKTAAFLPPPPNHVQDCMAALERFIHATNEELPDLVKGGLAHAQFETIHPFLDGNGRLGRLLITLMLRDAGLLRKPLLYLSLCSKRNRSTHYHLLNDLRHTGDWQAWLRFFLEGVREMAEGAVTTARSASETILANWPPGTSRGVGAARTPVTRRTSDRGHPSYRAANRPVRADGGRCAPAAGRPRHRARNHRPPEGQDFQLRALRGGLARRHGRSPRLAPAPLPPPQHIHRPPCHN